MGSRSVIGGATLCPGEQNTSPQFYESGYTLTRLTFTGGDGTEKEFVDASTGGQPENSINTGCPPDGNGFSRGTVFTATDGSGASFIASSPIYDSFQAGGFTTGVSGSLFMPNGVRYDFQGGIPTAIGDAEGNETTVAQNSAANGYVVTDSLQRQTTISYAELDQSPIQDDIFWNGAAQPDTGADGAGRNAYVVYGLMDSALISGQVIQDESCLFPTLQGSGSFDPYVVTQVTLPNQQAYTFQYNSYGDVARVTLPTGGAIEYDFPTTGASAGTGCGNGYPGYSTTIQRRISERRVKPTGASGAIEQRTDYAWTFEAPAASETTVAVTHYDPSSGNLISEDDHQYFGDPTQLIDTEPLDYTPWNEGKEFLTQFKDGSGNVLRTVANTWTQHSCSASGYTTTLGPYAADVPCWYTTSSNVWAYVTSATAPTHYPAVTQVDTTLENGLVSRTTHNFDGYNNETSLTEYDFGSGGPGSLIRTTASTYLANGYDTAQSTADATTHLRGLLTDRQVLNSSGTVVAEAKYAYDETSPMIEPNASGYIAPAASRQGCGGGVAAGCALGNLTTEQHWLNTGYQWLSRVRTYDNLGNALSVMDPKGYTTNYSFADNYSDAPGGFSTWAFATQVTLPMTGSAAPSACGTFLCTQTQYDYFIGAPTLFTDVNGEQTSFNYWNDSLDRLTQTVDMNISGTPVAQTLYTYSDAPGSVFAQKNIDQANFRNGGIASQNSYDGLGRQVDSIQFSDCGIITVNQNYDALGRVHQVSNPYNTPPQGPSPNPYSECVNESPQYTTTLSDALNRTTDVITADGADTHIAWTGNQRNVTDPAGVNVASVADAAGRTSSVTEAGATVTSYRYGALDDLLGVCHGGSFTGTSCSGDYSRTFVYDSLNRLTSASNPEAAGATTYTYDKDGNVQQKSDANGNTVTYAYDVLNRVTGKLYAGPNATPAVTYCYDATPGTGACAGAPSGSGLNLNGRLTLVSNSNSTTTYGQFDNQGNVLQSSQTTGGTPYPFTYTWNLAHGRTSMTLPSQRVVMWQYDGQNRVNGIGGVFQGNGKPYAYSVQYASHGAVSQMILGNGLYENRTYDPQRLQPLSITLGVTANDASYLSLAYSFCPAGGAPPCSTNNGNLMQQTIQPLNATQAYQYLDGRNRLTNVAESAAAGTWFRTYAYDPYGNGWLSAYTTASPSPGVSILTPTSDVFNINPANGPVNRFIGSNYCNNQLIPGSNYGYDCNGNQTLISPFSLTYDAENRQTSAMSQLSGSAAYAYDGDGRRVVKTVAGSSATTVYVYDAGGDLVAEYGAPALGCGTCFVTADHLGSTRVVTDQTQTVIARHDYLPFGEELATSNRTAALGYSDADGVEQKFTGKERDAETGLDFFGARYMSSAQDRFTSADKPFADQNIFDAQSWNLYTYVRNNPLRFVDRTGTQAQALELEAWITAHEPQLAMAARAIMTAKDLGTFAQAIKDVVWGPGTPSDKIQAAIESNDVGVAMEGIIGKLIEDRFPGDVVGVSVPVPNPTNPGLTLTDIDVGLKYALVEIKTGRNPVNLKQIANQKTLGVPVLVYAPQAFAKSAAGD